MTWNYRVAKDRSGFYGIVEVYYDEQGKVSSYTDFIDPNYWEDVEDLKFTLEKMLKAFENPVLEVVIE